MKKNDLEEYYDFFLELPPTDYLVDIEIQDEYEKTNDDPLKGLSDEQVSQIAIDSLNDANPPASAAEDSDQVPPSPDHQ